MRRDIMTVSESYLASIILTGIDPHNSFHRFGEKYKHEGDKSGGAPVEVHEQRAAS
jgi:hypothetical protein